MLWVCTVGSRFAAVRFMTIHFYDPCRVGPSTRGASLSQLKRPFSTYCTFSSFSVCMCFFFFYFRAVLKLIVIFPPMTSIKETEKKKKSKQLPLHSFFMSSEPQPGPSSAK
jgi:hypothetical protein